MATIDTRSNSTKSKNAKKKKLKKQKQNQSKKHGKEESIDLLDADSPRRLQPLAPPPGLDVGWASSRHKAVSEDERAVKTVKGYFPHQIFVFLFLFTCYFIFHLLSIPFIFLFRVLISLKLGCSTSCQPITLTPYVHR